MKFIPHILALFVSAIVASTSMTAQHEKRPPQFAD